MEDGLSHEYTDAVKAVMNARKRYRAACTLHGPDSRVAQQAREDVRQEIERRNDFRKRRAAAAVRAASGTVDTSGTLRALRSIEPVGDDEPFHIVPVTECGGTIMAAGEVTAAKVKWAERAGFSVVTKSVPQKFAPYNAVIRVHESGTEDQNRDYLAHILE